MTAAEQIPTDPRTRLMALSAEAAEHAMQARADLERLSTMLTAEPSAQAETLAANRRLAAAEQTITDAAESLRRLEAGTYGQCARCNEAIPAGRLEMRPHSRYCVTCT